MLAEQPPGAPRDHGEVNRGESLIGSRIRYSRGVSDPRRIPRILFAGAVLTVSGLAALADMVGYAKIVDIRAESATTLAEHHHDWSRATEPARFKMITTTKNPFTAENTYSYLRVVDKGSGRELFRAPVPALTQLWISPDSRYVVGISNIQLWNPYQLVVFTRTGRRVLEKAFGGEPWVRQSVTNWIEWYKEPTPTIRLEEGQGWTSVWIEDREGKPRQFRFRTPPEG